MAGHVTYLATTLGITESELKAAIKKAGEAAKKQAMADGKMDQRMADMLAEDRALHNYVALGLLIDEPA